MVPHAADVVPAKPGDLVREVRALVEGSPRLLLVRSRLTFGDALVRVGIFADAGGARPLLHAHALVRQAHLVVLEAALKALGPVDLGGWDAHFADTWHWVWSVRPDVTTLWGREEGVTATATRGALLVHDYAIPDVAGVELVIDPTLAHRTLQATCRSVAPVVILAVEDETPLIDPTYDRTSLGADTAWMEHLGEALAAAVGVRFVGV
jgi:hypothetical protein